MSKRYWVIAASLGLTVFCAAVWYSWDRFSTYQQNQADERAAAAEYQANTAQHSPASCRSVMDERGFFDWFTCLANNVSADGGVKQAEYDLKAQQDMSAWALGMLIATVWLTVITLLGVFFVWRTLKATQDMAKDTREIGEAQVRAYLSFKCEEAGCREPVLDASDITAERPNIVVEINGRYINSGQTPAFNTNLFYDIREIKPHKEMRKLDVDDFHNSGVAMHALPPGGESPTTLKRTFKANLSKIKSGELVIWFAVTIKYTDIFGIEQMTPVISGVLHNLISSDHETRVYWDKRIASETNQQS